LFLQRVTKSNEIDLEFLRIVNRESKIAGVGFSMRALVNPRFERQIDWRILRQSQ
jgi:hypothetical protein